MGEDFLKEYGEVFKQVKADPASVDLRAFIRDELNGQIMVPMFSKIGRAFTSYYYGEPDSPNFPRDIENYALEYLGPEKYYSDEFQFKAALFIPFDEMCIRDRFCFRTGGVAYVYQQILGQLYWRF